MLDVLIATDDRARALRDLSPEIKPRSFNRCRGTGRLQDGRVFRIVGVGVATLIPAAECRRMLYGKEPPLNGGG